MNSMIFTTLVEADIFCGDLRRAGVKADVKTLCHGRYEVRWEVEAA
jgi:hypothetical protein